MKVIIIGKRRYEVSTVVNCVSITFNSGTYTLVDDGGTSYSVPKEYFYVRIID